MTEAYTLTLPLLYFLWCFCPMSNWESEKAARSAFHATYPKVAKGGNNPASQRVHEVGGLRLNTIISCAIMVGIAQIPADIIGIAVAQFFSIFITFIVLRKWIDIGEHFAESLHAEANGFPDYRYREAARMTAKGEEYDNMSASDFVVKMKSAKGRAKLITAFAKLP